MNKNKKQISFNLTCQHTIIVVSCSFCAANDLENLSFSIFDGNKKVKVGLKLFLDTNFPTQLLTFVNFNFPTFSNDFFLKISRDKENEHEKANEMVRLYVVIGNWHRNIQQKMQWAYEKVFEDYLSNIERKRERTNNNISIDFDF